MAKRMREYRSQKELKRDAEDVSEKIADEVHEKIG
jgi:hypothetical protein